MSTTPTQRLRWGCRRGMLELDLLLLPFFDACFASLDAATQADFERLLVEPDPLLFQWLLGIAHPEDPRLAALCGMIKQFKMEHDV